MADQSGPKFQPFDLTELVEAGVLMSANERFFWPLGLALTWELDPDRDGEATHLHVRQWLYPDGHQETIATTDEDGVAPRRRAAFKQWHEARLGLMSSTERDASINVLSPDKEP